MSSATRASGEGGGGFHKGVMEHKVIMNFRAVSGNKFILRQWQQKFTTALGQIGGGHEEIVLQLVKEIDLGKKMGTVGTGLSGEYGDEFDKYPEMFGTF